MFYRRYSDHSVRNFLKRTVAAQLHLIGCIAAALGFFILLRSVRTSPDPSHFWACLVFGITSILVFAASTICHIMNDGFQISQELDRRLEDIDQISIFLFIAGTYTPVILNVISPPWSRILLFLVWAICVGGIAYTYLRLKLPQWARHRYVNTAIYVIMGWVLVLRIGEALNHLTSREAFFLIAGGLSYTIGAVVYALKRPNPFAEIFGFHEIWHFLVLVGYSFHYFMILEFYS